MKIDSIQVARIVALTGGHVVSSCYDPEKEIGRISIDSRRCENARDCLFVALQTRNGDGHCYIGELYGAGIRFFLVSRLPEDISAYPEAVFIQVDDTLAALQRWAGRHRQSFRIPVVGITGSNGKTWVKEWLSFLLGFDEEVVCSPKSYNSQIGVPLSLLQMREGHEIGVFEAGISQPGEMERLNRMICPTVGIFTNIGSAHEANFSSREQKIEEKLKLFRGAGTLIYCADHAPVRKAILQNPEFSGKRLLSWSVSAGCCADLTVAGMERDGSGMNIRAYYHGEEISLKIPFFDKASVENALHCLLFLLDCHYPAKEIGRRFLQLPVVEMRMEMKEGVYRSSLISDVCNSDFQSFAMALDFLCSQGRNRNRCVILSDILQSSLSEKELYGDVSRLLRQRGIEAFIGVGPALLRQQSLFSGISTRFYATTEDFLSEMKPGEFADKAILIKGARMFGFERVSRALQRKVHETVMEVNLTAMIHNLKFFRGLIKPQTKLMVMGKAFSYGSGGHEIADMLEYNHVDYLMVAYPDEAVALRSQGVRIPILCMNPESGGMETLLKYGVEPVVYNFRMLQSILEYSRSLPDGESFPVGVHIAFDTGMHRMGFEEKDLEELLSCLQACPFCQVRSVFTHLATADMPEMDAFTLDQIACYERMSAKFVLAFPYKILRHCLNTAGIFRFPQYQYDMVRLGIGLYGVGTDDAMQSHLETVSTLKTVISLIRRIPAGDAVGYGRRFIAGRDTTVGVIGIGYADGLDRHLGNGKGRVWVNGQQVPIIGSICMDMCMIDLTDVDAREQDEVIIFGRELPIGKLAETLDTIPYEILTGISPRVKRIYYQE